MVSAGYNEDTEAEAAKGKDPGMGRKGSRASQRCPVQCRETNGAGSNVPPPPPPPPETLVRVAYSLVSNGQLLPFLLFPANAGTLKGELLQAIQDGDVDDLKGEYAVRLVNLRAAPAATSPNTGVVSLRLQGVALACL